jgi:hypothetical protein
MVAMRFFCLMLLLAAGVGLPSRQQAAGPRPQAVFFNGKDLTGWEGLKQFWSVKDGAIVGSAPGGARFNTFLCSTEEYKDFELKFRVKLTGKGWTGNSGVNIRSEILDRNKLSVSGPQCDMGQYYWGCLYGERFGSGMMKQADEQRVKKVLKAKEFNDYYVKCVGKHVTIKLNDLTTVDDDFVNLPPEGIIAWQLHAGPPMEVIFKNIEFKDLSNK